MADQTVPAAAADDFHFDHAAFNVVTLPQAARALAMPALTAHDEFDFGGKTSRASRFDALLMLAEREALAIADAAGS